MGLFDQFPYTNFHELNLDWILKALKELEKTIEQFVSINALKYANPIQWDITSQYEKNTIVIDPQTATAYISVQPVPAGVALTETDYWTVVFNLKNFVVRAAQNFTTRYEENTTLTATFSSAAGDWLVWGDTLYVANVNITAGDSYIVGGNIRHITMEEITGHLDNLSTTNKNNLVAAINELVTNLAAEALARAAADGTLQTNITAEAQARAAADGTLQTAISANSTQIQTLTTNMGSLTNLETTEKSSIVGAINELANKDITQNVLLIGDSFCDENRGGYARGVATAIQEFMKLDDDHFHIFAIGGAGFIANGWGKTFGDLLADAVNDTSFNHEAITDLIVQTAGNDVGSGESAVSSINSALSSFIITANTYFPNARIFIAPTLSRMESPRNYTFRRQLQYVLANTGRIFTIITNASLPMRLIRCFTDAVHPNATGCKMLGKLIGSALLGGSNIGEFYETRLDDFTIALDSSLTAIFNREHWVTGHGDSLILNFVGLGVSGSIAIQNTLTSGAGSILLGTESSLVPNTDTANGLSLSEIPVHAIATIGSTDVELAQATLNIVLIENDYTKCNLYLAYRYCPTSGTATRIMISPTRVDYQV